MSKEFIERDTDEMKRMGKGQPGKGAKLQASLMLLFALFPSIAVAQSIEIDPRIKAAFVYNLLKFTDWSAQSGVNSITLCVSNSDSSLESAFSAINGRIANGRTVVMRFLSDTSQLSSCNAIYLHDGSAKKLLGQISATQKDLLTISDTKDFINAGGVVGMLVGDDGRLKFEINLEASRHANYQLSAQLLKLARNAQ